MENIFSFKRFWLLVRKHANENRTNFLFLFGAMIIAVLFTEFISAFNRLISNGNEQEAVFKNYISFMVLIGGIYTGLFFKKWENNSRASSVLMLPATAAEKIVLVMFYSIVVFIPVFTIVFYGFHFALSEIFKHSNPFQFIKQYNGLTTLPAIIFYALLPYTFFHSFFLLCSVWFKNRQIVIAFGVIILIFIIGAFLNNRYLYWLSGYDQVFYSSQLVYFPADLKYTISGGIRIITSPMIRNINILILTICTLLLYWASYLKLNEKEV